LAVGLRTTHLIEFTDWNDEVWSLWHVQGSLSEALSRVPADWPPVFSVLTWGWMQAAGPKLEVARYMMVLLAALGIATFYQAVLAWLRLAGFRRPHPAAAFAALLMTGMGYAVLTGVEVRAYGLLLWLGAAALWACAHWLRRPESRWRSLMVAVLFVLLFGTSFTAAPFLILLSGLVLLYRPLLIVHSMGVGVLSALLASPFIFQFLQNASERLDRVKAMPPFTEAVSLMYRQFTGSWLVVGVFGLGCLLFLWMALRRGGSRRWLIGLLIWSLLPLVGYWFMQTPEFYTPRYWWWVLPALLLVMAGAVVWLPRRVQLTGMLLAAGIGFIPVDFTQYRVGLTGSPPIRQMLEWLQPRLRPGDVLIRDPECACGDEVPWDYFMDLYYPTGDLPIVQSPLGHRRVWYLATTGWPQDDDLRRAIEQGRLAGEFIGPWNFLLRLYEAPPAAGAAVFGDMLRFNGFEVEGNREVFREDDVLRLRLWWSALAPIDRDYTVSITVLDRQGRLVAQDDRQPNSAETPAAMTAWRVGRPYVDEREIRLPAGLDEGSYQLLLTVYWWETVERLPVRGSPRWVFDTEERYLVLRHFRVMSF
jgi:hypothetical protein